MILILFSNCRTEPAPIIIPKHPNLENEIRWNVPSPLLARVALEENKLLFIYVIEKDCYECMEFKSTTLTDPVLINVVNTYCVSSVMFKEEWPDLRESFLMSHRLPVILIIPPRGTEYMLLDNNVHPIEIQILVELWANQKLGYNVPFKQKTTRTKIGEHYSFL